MEKVLQAYEELKAQFPRLKSSWAWEHLAGTCFDKGRYEDFLTLVNQDLYQPTDAFIMRANQQQLLCMTAGLLKGIRP